MPLRADTPDLDLCCVPGDFTVTKIPSGYLIGRANEPGRSGRLLVQDIEGGAPPRAITPEGFSMWGKAVSPDGQTIVFDLLGDL